MGGTSFDVGLVLDGHDRNYEFDPVIDRWRVHLPVLANYSIGAGGGSIAYVTDEGELRVGPRSAGSVPGPACYQQGGTEPTVTDADLVLGYLDPGYFLGGGMTLSERHARRAIQRRVADPLGLELEEAAQRIRRLIDGTMGQEIYRQTALKGYDPREFTMLAFGGAGPVHACDIADYSDVSSILTFPQGSEFNAFGVSTMPVLQSYERTRAVELYDGDAFAEDGEDFNAVVRDLVELAERDMAEEGFAADSCTLRLELDMNYGGQHHTVRLESPRMYLESEADIAAVCDELQLGLRRPPTGMARSTLRAASTCSSSGSSPLLVAPRSASSSAPTMARAATRREGEPARLVAHSRDWADTPVLERALLAPGFTIEGPALLEDIDTVVAVAPGWFCELDERRTGWLRRLD